MYGPLTQRIIITEEKYFIMWLSYRWFPDSESSIKDNLAEYFQERSSLFASQWKSICEYGKRSQLATPELSGLKII